MEHEMLLAFIIGKGSLMLNLISSLLSLKIPSFGFIKVTIPFSQSKPRVNILPAPKFRVG